MGTFGEDLRTERLTRGIALEQISAVTKISSRHLLALEQDRFRVLPGGILSKGIVRGYASAVGLDQEDWTRRFLQACGPDEAAEENRDWTEFASNVGKARILRHDVREIRLRWIGALALVLIVTAVAFFAVRYYGIRAGWWTTLLPAVAHSTRQALGAAVHSVYSRVIANFGS